MSADIVNPLDGAGVPDELQADIAAFDALPETPEKEISKGLIARLGEFFKSKGKDDEDKADDAEDDSEDDDEEDDDSGDDDDDTDDEDEDEGDNDDAEEADEEILPAKGKKAKKSVAADELSNDEIDALLKACENDDELPGSGSMVDASDIVAANTEALAEVTEALHKSLAALDAANLELKRSRKRAATDVEKLNVLVADMADIKKAVGESADLNKSVSEYFDGAAKRPAATARKNIEVGSILEKSAVAGEELQVADDDDENATRGGLTTRQFQKGVSSYIGKSMGEKISYGMAQEMFKKSIKDIPMEYIKIAADADKLPFDASDTGV